MTIIITKPVLFWFSASYDSTIRIWDTQSCTCLHTLNGHEDPVHSISFQPVGDFLVSGAMDGHINIWSIQVCLVKFFFFLIILKDKRLPFELIIKYIFISLFWTFLKGYLQFS